MLRLVVSNQTNPFLNIAVENYLLSLPETDCITLYLWKNHRTVVIGQNQNPFAECQVELLEKEGGYLMRRRTGGGAVYHDDGNINFSFIVPHSHYDLSRQFSVIQKAVESYGIQTQVSGRNDLLCLDQEGSARKFSGNAFNKNKYQHLHHGTILIKGNMEDLQRYLLVKPAKLRKHGVDSVRSRVINLNELADVTSQNIVPRLIAAFEEVYGEPVHEESFSQLIQLPAVISLRQELESEEWRFGRWRQFRAQKTGQFPWGLVELNLDVDQTNGIIQHMDIATDSLSTEIAPLAQQLLTGASIYQRPNIPDTCSQEIRTMLSDIISIIFE